MYIMENNRITAIYRKEDQDGVRQKGGASQ